MTIHLTPELEKLVESKIDSGSFNSATEVIAAALRDMAAGDKLRAGQLETLNLRIEQGLAELDRGDYVDGESFMQKLLDDLDQRIAADTRQ
jgi:antitoxin ParD1/3/4